MKYILTVLAAALTLSACCTKQCDVHAHGKTAKADKCCDTGKGDCCKKH